MPKSASDMPTSPEDIEQDAQEVFGDVAEMIDAILVIGQLNPLEIVNGQPRWNKEQQALIIKCTDQVGDWER